MFAQADHIESLFCNIHDCHHIVPLVFFANEEFVIGRERNSAALANETNEGHFALYQLKITRRQS